MIDMELVLNVEDLSDFSLISSTGERWKLVRDNHVKIPNNIENSTYGDTNWALSMVKVSWNIFKGKVLFPNRRVLEREGIVIYGGNGQPYKFHKEKFKRWLDANGGKFRWEK